MIANTGFSQLYELKNPARDSANRIRLYDDLEELADSFYSALLKEDLTLIKKFVPDVKFLKSTFDTLAIEYREDQVIYRQQMLMRGLQKDLHKILKKSEKEKVNLQKIEVKNTHFEYGMDEKDNEYCYVTIQGKRRKHEYQWKYLAIKLNDKWFIGDELSFEEL